MRTKAQIYRVRKWNHLWRVNSKQIESRKPNLLLSFYSWCCLSGFYNLCQPQNLIYFCAYEILKIIKMSDTVGMWAFALSWSTYLNLNRKTETRSEPLYKNIRTRHMSLVLWGLVIIWTKLKYDPKISEISTTVNVFIYVKVI